jgi:heptosyltransferase-2
MSVDRGGFQRILAVLPNWVGDVVLATPVLAALREHFRESRITLLLRRYVSAVVAGGGWCDETMCWPDGRRASDDGRSAVGTAAFLRHLRAGRFDLALLLTNSFRSALAAWLGGARRRVGYARDGRSWLLTDRLRPLKRDGQFIPAPVLDAYIRLAEHVGCRVSDRRLRLVATPDDVAEAEALRRQYHLDNGRRYAVINPGAAYGAAKCWPAERFAAVCDRLADEAGLLSVIVGAPHEAPLMRRVVELSRTSPACCDRPGTTLGALKPLIRDAALLICNDTGPRHYGNAFGVPTVTIFGPTHQAWTDTGYAGEVKLQASVECGPCQLKTCPLDHRCMTRLAVDDVMRAAHALLERRRAAGAAHVA